jgi:hypothetical protein
MKYYAVGEMLEPELYKPAWTYYKKKKKKEKTNGKWQKANCRRMHTLWCHLYKV